MMKILKSSDRTKITNKKINTTRGGAIETQR